MMHLGDITKINGAEVPVVDCIIGGSPCQDLSVANGKRKGLDGERSGLYMEQIRLIKEMRNKDVSRGRTGHNIRPRFMLWENVPGAFSSNKGEDFRIVLEEAAKVADSNAIIPRPADGKWTTAGLIMADGWSIAWRVLDAQFWGVPQRRRRIALVADFGGQSASEILFVRKSLSGDLEQGGEKRKGTSSDVERSSSSDYREGVTYTVDMGGGKSAVDIHEDRSPTLTCTHYGEPAVVYDARGNGDGHTVPTMTGDHQNRITDYTGVVVSVDRASFNQGQNAKFDIGISKDGVAHTVISRGPGAVAYEDVITTSHGGFMVNPSFNVANALEASDWKDAPTVAYPCNWDGKQTSPTLTANNACGSQRMPDKDNCNLVIEKSVGLDTWNMSLTVDKAKTIISGSATDSNHLPCVVNKDKVKYIVRRLTPMECERLQGYPDGWTDIGEYTDTKGKKCKTSDAARYKALGNSIALPQWKWVLKRLCACYERDATMASLFDGIGGFPYIWEQLNGKGSCLWASEIEEFPIAVTKKRIGE